MAAYLVTVFLSSFLLFQVEPLIGRYILPWFGGSPAVWTTCMLFFQAMLLIGYGYAHAVTTALPKKQSITHLVLLFAALPFLPIAPSAALWKKVSADFPAWEILLLLLANIGVPYLVLSATAPLLQHWFVRDYPEKSPYRLYALSNAASLLALVTYPFVVEPHLALREQVSVWSWAFFVFVLCCAWCAARHLSPPAAGAERGEVNAEDPAHERGALSESDASVPAGLIVLWLMLSACGSAALLATTNQICQEVAVVPFLWIAPLTLYLTTFIICFNSDRAYHRTWWGVLFVGSAIPACAVLHARVGTPLPVQLLVFLGALFACCMACHGELARSRPHAEKLTAYYLIMSAGGVIGGIFVALLAPVAFDGFWELPIVFTVSAAVLACAYRREGILSRSRPWRTACAAAVVLAFAGFTAYHLSVLDSGTVAHSRSFYGVLRVVTWSDRRGPVRLLLNGRVSHGFQYTDAALRTTPTSYYTPSSGAGLALRYHPNRRRGAASRSLRVGVIGLGTGTLAAYGKGGDTFRFYEINNDVIAFADRHFTFLRDSGAKVETVPGDARIVLESELAGAGGQEFDVLLVDAFTSDSIPVHLLTRECVEIYRRHLKRDGLLLIHVTNHFLDLVPVVVTHARQMGLQAVKVNSWKDDAGGLEATWMIVTANREFLEQEEVISRIAARGGEKRLTREWTDDFVSLWQILKW
ncbi:fused MFS/spermidine synthase [Geomonas sp. RF6]|uniref:fused MFS/spermidine synthase n=1 Tax=Geomonas sp. RF6 TaxID=2897342 RepID=UPI001E41487D|nr:fused MFS/spermidine synthase [Geomonas sp. RF6]UFS69332.1 fused MFS/spermidine synthase [Geomonas sp. RF6]